MKRLRLYTVWALLKLLGDVGIDVALSPRTATANGVLRFVRGDVAAVATFLHGDTEVLELEVAVDSPADGALVKDLGLPQRRTHRGIRP